MNKLFAGLMLTGAILCAPLSAVAQTGPVKIFGLVELSGTGATSGTNFESFAIVTQ